MRRLQFPVSLTLIQLLCLGCFSLWATRGLAQSPAADGTPVVVPSHDIGIETLAKRKKAQLATENQFKVFYGFHFTDEVKASGITFRYDAVDDEKQNYKATHYDHGRRRGGG